MVKLIREFEMFLLEHHIFITKGLWDDISDCGLLKSHQNTNLLRCKRDGGILECTAMVVDGNLDVVIFLIDPTDMASLFPDRAALKRECVAKNKFFLSTYASAREWATLA
jgi:methylglyoxal synthase